MSQPVIGLTAYTGENRYGHPIVALMEKYVIAICEAGGIPVLIPSQLFFKSWMASY